VRSLGAVVALPAAVRARAVKLLCGSTHSLTHLLPQVSDASCNASPRSARPTPPSPTRSSVFNLKSDKKNEICKPSWISTASSLRGLEASVSVTRSEPSRPLRWPHRRGPLRWPPLPLLVLSRSE